ncbi:MAG: response regulator [Rhodoferax sp.]|nr:response regulator [Rhodoferax sp.]
MQPQRTVGVLALGVAVFLVGLLIYDLQAAYAQQFSIALQKTHSLAQLLEEHARQTMRRVQLSMVMAAQEVDRIERASSAFGRASHHVALSKYLPQDQLIASLYVLDANGRSVVSTLTATPEDLPSAEGRDFFLAQRGATQPRLFVGAAVQNPITAQWVIPVSLPLQGAVQGYLVAELDPQYFQSLYQSIDIGAKGFVALFTEQGWAVAGVPFKADAAERNWRNSPLFTEHSQTRQDVGNGRMTRADGSDSVFSYRAMREYPLRVAVGISLEDALLPWRVRAAQEIVAVLLMLLVLGGATLLVQSHLRARLRAESALQLSEISLLKSSLPTLWIGPDARILRVNQAACDLHGRSQEQMLKMTVIDLNPSMAMERWPAHWERLQKTRHMHFETVHRNAQGVDVPVEVELNFIEFEGREYNFAFMRDLTARKRADAELQQSAAMLRGAMDAVDEAFVLFDAQERLVYCNAKYRAMYAAQQSAIVPGVRFEELLHSGAEQGVYPDATLGKQAWVAERLRAFRGGNQSRIQRQEDGRVVRVIDRKTPEGNTVGIRMDITEMVRATEEAQEASRSKSQFLANMSHEIRTPMNAILGLLSLLQQTGLTPVQRDYVINTKGAAQSLLGLLNDILDFSKVEAGKLELDPQPFRLDRLLRDLAVILSSNLEGKFIEVLFDVDATLPAVLVGDAMRLQQVLVNLCGNAIKFTHQGQVVLRVRKVPTPAVPTPAVPTPVTALLSEAEACRQSWLEFSVQDSGIGIASEQQTHIFSAFYQAEASTTRRFGGTGLGLAICKRLVETMGGTLTMQSTMGIGSTFAFVLPLALGEEPVGLLREEQHLSLPPRRVLVVDDNPLAREILSATTRSWCWPTEVAGSGAEALAQVRKHLQDGQPPFDVIYLDWQMPGMNGWETLSLIRSLCPSPQQQPQVVMISANPRDSLHQRSEAEQTMVNGFLFKPVTPSGLQEAAQGLPRDVRLPLLYNSSPRSLAGMRILVVEDNLINQQVAEELLHAEGALVSLAANGQIGVEAVAASDPGFDVVLMDIQMPVLDGFGAARKIRKELHMTHLPIVAMTANALDSDRQNCLQAGMDEHIGKPFDIRQLVAVLLQVTGRSAEAQATATQPAENPPPETRPIHSSSLYSGPHLSPYLDQSSALARLAGAADLYRSIAREFAKQLGAVAADYQEAARRHDLLALARQMHTLKGTAATVGALRLSEHANRLEKMFRQNPQANVASNGVSNGVSSVADQQLPQLLEVLAMTRQALAEEVDTRQSAVASPCACAAS